VIDPSGSLEPPPFSVTAAPVLPETSAPAFATGERFAAVIVAVSPARPPRLSSTISVAV